jgi:hypothetical protein
MALVKNISTEYGVYASYWKITEISLNLDGSCDFVLSGYLNKETRNGNLLHLKKIEFHIDQPTVVQYFPSGVDLAQVYAYLKTTGEFGGAEDI